MEQLEIIITRIPAFSRKEISNDMLELLKAIEKIQEANEHIGFFHNIDNPDDYAFIAVLSSYSTENEKSNLGSLIADALRHFGLVNYSCWTATDIQDIPNLLVKN